MLKHEKVEGQFLDSLHLEKETRWKTVNSQGCRTLRGGKKVSAVGFFSSVTEL